MKKISFAVIVLLVLFASCSKEESAKNYHVSFSVDGVNKTYTGFVAAHIDTFGTDLELTILGTNSVTSGDDYFGIYINNYPGGGKISAGEYKDNSANFTVLSTFHNPIDNVEYESGQSMAEEAVYYGIPIANHFKVNITSLDGKTAKGTFSGDYFYDGDVNDKKISITNGDFYVKFQ